MDSFKPATLKIFSLISLLFSLYTLYQILIPRTALAQVPQPYVPCNETRPNEFNSLRPYQASPCVKEVSQTANFCGNRLVLTDSVTAVQTTSPAYAPNCTFIENNLYQCTYKVTGKTANYKIDLSKAKFPILGNTEDNLNDAQKTNDYVSWYLNGVNNRAESTYLNSNNPTDLDKLVNFSGPLNKLLPWEVQLNDRITSIKAAGNSQHDQMVACEVAGIPVPCNDQGVIGLIDTKLRLSYWNGHLPPLPSDSKYQGKDFSVYWKDYQRWRGNSCTPDFTIPVINKNIYLCFDNPLKPNFWSNLFAYIPMSSTEDRKGEVAVESQNVSAASPDLKISNVNLTTTPADLFFAHTEEANGLAEKLQMTFVPQGGDTTGAVTGVSPAEACDLTNIRSNPGDNLFAGTIDGNLTYDAEFTCNFQGIATESACKKDVSVGLGVTTKTPLADDLWSRLVAGPAGIFKRIFPKVGEGGAILGILDIPAATKVSYSGSGVSAANPGQRSGESAELYFPHVGGISEYFLKGIQTILRPKGFGEQIISGEPGTFTSSGKINCDTSAPDVSLRGTIDKQAYFQLALNWLGGQPGTNALECYNDTVRKAREAGINTALTLWLWLHESDASNYDLGYLQDFGAASPAPVGYVDQINEFFARARRYTPSSPLCSGRNVTPIQAFAYIYKSGTCDPNTTDAHGVSAADFYQAMVDQWSLVSSCPFPNSPTDTSCQN
ncbi:hypothetical protein MUP46_01350 [Patescibacteria group bacterium]|nr:hypothetical protein [Patescibacteria group bacterium]